MKRTTERILNAVKNQPVPKSIRIKTLQKLLVLNVLITITPTTDISTKDLKYNPKKCVDYIMKIFHMNRRTAYDYYTTLLYLNYLLPAHCEDLSKKIYDKEKISDSFE